MIVRHPLRLLFVKTKKVGGTSFEIARFPAVGGAAALDNYIRYESIEAELRGIRLADAFEIFHEVRAKGDIRPGTGTSIAEIYAASPTAATLVAKHCSAEMLRFGYAVPMAIQA